MASGTRNWGIMPAGNTMSLFSMAGKNSCIGPGVDEKPKKKALKKIGKPKTITNNDDNR